MNGLIRCLKQIDMLKFSNKAEVWHKAIKGTIEKHRVMYDKGDFIDCPLCATNIPCHKCINMKICSGSWLADRVFTANDKLTDAVTRGNKGVPEVLERKRAWEQYLTKFEEAFGNGQRFNILKARSIQYHIWEFGFVRHPKVVAWIQACKDTAKKYRHYEENKYILWDGSYCTLCDISDGCKQCIVDCVDKSGVIGAADDYRRHNTGAAIPILLNRGKMYKQAAKDLEAGFACGEDFDLLKATNIMKNIGFKPNGYVSTNKK